ncbi:MAG: hypothetical protein QW098_01850 [Candidatus Hadarchaeales archaeon]
MKHVIGIMGLMTAIIIGLMIPDSNEVEIELGKEILNQLENSVTTEAEWKPTLELSQSFLDLLKVLILLEPFVVVFVKMLAKRTR